MRKPDRELIVSNRSVAALLPAILREHRVQHDGAVGVKADPVVRKDRVRCVRLRCVVEGVHSHAGSAQCGGERLELPRGGGLHLRRPTGAVR